VLHDYDILWTSQSENAAGSMPVGGFDCGANVWVEENDILIYVDRSGSFDENNQMLKLGRFRIHTEPQGLQDSFSQRLCLHDGYIRIRGTHGFEAVIRFDTDRPCMRISVRAEIPVALTASYETWRTAPMEVPVDPPRSAMTYHGYAGEVLTFPDAIQPEADRLWFSHRNRADRLVFDFLV